MAWVEMKLAFDLAGFTCSTCPVSTQEHRKCHDDIWNHPTGKIFPLKLMEAGAKHDFCPAKLFRDDPLFVFEMDTLWLSWKLGQVPNGEYIGTISPDEFESLATMIRHWEIISRFQDYDALARMLGGKKNKKGK